MTQDMPFAEAIRSGSPPSAATKDSGDLEKTGDMEQSGGSGIPLETVETQISNGKKNIPVYLASLSLWLAVLLVSLEPTGLAVAVPVYSGPAVVIRILVLMLPSEGDDDTARWNGTRSFLDIIAFTLAVTVVKPVYVRTSDALGHHIPLFAAHALFFLGKYLTCIIIGSKGNVIPYSVVIYSFGPRTLR
jgi:hypothetical protein